MMILKMIDYIGFLGPYILLIISLFLLYKKKTLLVYYVFGYLIDILINAILKITLKQPRPKEHIPLFNATKAHQPKLLSFQQYGMPSGHAQDSLYSTFFIFFALHGKQYNYIKLLYFILTINTCCQRVRYKNHTILQVLVGAIIGSVVGVITFYLATKKIKGILHYKFDDNAPI
jgi:membrane-associated phospholipid phosphatase